MSSALNPAPRPQRFAGLYHRFRHIRFADLYQRFRHVIHEGAKFGIVGLTGILVTYVVFIPLHAVGAGPLTSVTVATTVATVVTFLGNRYWSFRGREGSGTAREGVIFFVLNGIGLLIQYAVLGLSNYVLGLTTNAENVVVLSLGIGLGTLFRFWSYRKWVWVPPDVRLAQLRRGRHRLGRDLSAIPPAPDRGTLRAVPPQIPGSYGQHQPAELQIPFRQRQPADLQDPFPSRQRMPR